MANQLLVIFGVSFNLAEYTTALRLWRWMDRILYSSATVIGVQWLRSEWNVPTIATKHYGFLGNCFQDIGFSERSVVILNAMPTKPKAVPSSDQSVWHQDCDRQWTDLKELSGHSVNFWWIHSIRRPSEWRLFRLHNNLVFRSEDSDCRRWPTGRSAQH